jgi:MFS transporter, DHA1 family, tetracycline resistance protein
LDDRSTKSQLPYLFLYNQSILFVGMGLMPLLPLYAQGFGATPKITGLYLSVIYLSFTASTLLTGVLTARFNLKKLFIWAGLSGIPAIFLMGQVTALWQLIILTSLVWFFGGIGASLVNVFTGLQAGQESRGRWFSVISLTSPVGSLTGGLVVGSLVDAQGYPLLFVVLSCVWAVWPVMAYFKLEDKGLIVSQPANKGAGSKMPMREKVPLLLLLLAILFSMLTINTGRLGLPMVMALQDYTSGAVASAMAFGGLVTLPFAFFLGLLSDRYGRKNILILGYMMAVVSVLILILANHTWQFWLAASLLLIALTVSGSVASAFATDLLTPGVLVRVLPWFTAVGSVAGILGFAGAGFLIETLGFTGLFLGAASVSLVASALIWPLRCERQIAAMFEPGWSCDLTFRPRTHTIVEARIDRPTETPLSTGVQNPS